VRTGCTVLGITSVTGGAVSDGSKGSLETGNSRRGAGGLLDVLEGETITVAIDISLALGIFGAVGGIGGVN